MSPDPVFTNHDDLIFDVGMHDGQDTEFYLKKGFRVVSIEANPVLAEGARERFKDALASGQLTILDVAISDTPGTIDFYVNRHNSKWSSVHKKWGARGAKGFEVVSVTTRSLADIAAEYGAPYYLKIDIEGEDINALRSINGFPTRPKFVSVEGGGAAFLNIFRELGYDRFSVVNQQTVPELTQPDPPREGKAATHTFPMGASGPFGREVPDAWLDYDDALAEREAFKALMQRVSDECEGDQLKIMKRREQMKVGWFDVHAGCARFLAD